MQQVVFLLLIGLVLIQADSLLEMDAHCAEECGSPEYDELVKELDHQDEVLNDLVTRAVNVEHSLDQSKKEHDDADRESRNLLLRLDRLHSDKEHDVCPKKHRKCLTSAARDGKPCVANILVCDGEEDCLDGSDEDPELCRFPMEENEVWNIKYAYQNCTAELLPEGGEVFFSDIHRADHFPGHIKVSGMISYQEVHPGEHRHRIAFHLSGMYSMAERKIKVMANFGGTIFENDFIYDPQDDVWNQIVHRYFTGATPCMKTVISRKPH